MKLGLSIISVLLGLLMVPLTSVLGQSSAEIQDDLRTFNIEAGKLIKVRSEVTNNITGTLTFAYIVQIRDMEGATVQLSWMDGIKVAPKEKVQAVQSWIPEEPGEYLVEIFVWESIANPDPMSPVRKALAVVS